ncbi:hypothetical protein GHT06_002311 [Daphnia sinensis]|uniref:Uncharacterized protein n=1 Tax=Daphnia sinensis TaxID=1820382 RepID=A0AAD5KX56_9CRUS|nr:hypothetical protein GHT06_002311 [Daphnia sinensis]
MVKRRRNFEDSSSSDSSSSSSSIDTSDDSSTDSCVAPRPKRSGTPPVCIQEDPNHPKACGSGTASAALVALSTLIRATLGGAVEEGRALVQETTEECEVDAIEVPADAAAAGDGLAHGRPDPAVGQALMQLASFIKAQHAPKDKRKKRLKPTIKQCRRMLKRLRRGVSNKRVGQLKSKYRLDVEDSLDFKVPSIDFEMHLKLQKLLGPSIGKGVNDVEKTLYKVQQSMLPIFAVLTFLESKGLEGDAGKAIFFDVSDLRRRNILEIVGPAIAPLLEDRDIFEVSEGRDLFGSSVMKRLSKSGRFVRELVDLDVGGQRKGKLPVREHLSLSSDSHGQQSGFQARQSNHSSGRIGNISDVGGTQRHPSRFQQPDSHGASGDGGDQSHQGSGSTSRWSGSQQDWSNTCSKIRGKMRHFWRAWGAQFRRSLGS